MVVTLRTGQGTSRAAIGAWLVIGLGVLGQAASTRPVRAAIGPRIEAAQTEIDLGDVVKGDSVEARFELRNSGDEMLHIARVKPG